MFPAEDKPAGPGSDAAAPTAAENAGMLFDWLGMMGCRHVTAESRQAGA